MKKLSTDYDSFEAEKDTDFNGREFKQVFSSNVSSCIGRINIKFNDENLSNVLIRGVAILKDDETKRETIFEERGVGFFSFFDKPLYIGPSHYFGIETQGLSSGSPPGGKISIVAKYV